MRAKLAPLARIEPALEEGAEDGGVDLRPVERRGTLQQDDVVGLKLQGSVGIEQTTVEPGDRGEVDLAATFRHGGEQAAGVKLELAGTLASSVEHAFEQARRQ